MAVLAGVLALSGAVLLVLSPFLAGSKLVVDSELLGSLLQSPLVVLSARERLSGEGGHP